MVLALNFEHLMNDETSLTGVPSASRPTNMI